MNYAIYWISKSIIKKMFATSLLNFSTSNWIILSWKFVFLKKNYWKRLHSWRKFFETRLLYIQIFNRWSNFFHLQSKWWSRIAYFFVVFSMFSKTIYIDIILQSLWNEIFNNETIFCFYEITSKFWIKKNSNITFESIFQIVKA